MKKNYSICVLDAFTSNPGDLSWDALRQFGELQVYERSPEEKVIERAKDADILLTNKVILDEDLIKKLPRLKYIGVLATGYNVVDIHAAKAHNIVVTNIPAYSTDSVAQMVFAHVLNIYNQVQYHAQEVKKGRWSGCRDFSFFDKPLMELKGKTMGIVG
ncbi:MAG TPA: D-2-hydroxyacid dehydrogenase, partial [Bacteroidales bacterium]|nr:D-2-hydroxyacid dehydrogenase [Bacteroidales bacterium]